MGCSSQCLTKSTLKIDQVSDNENNNMGDKHVSNHIKNDPNSSSNNDESRQEHYTINIPPLNPIISHSDIDSYLTKNTDEQRRNEIIELEKQINIYSKIFKINLIYNEITRVQLIEEVQITFNKLGPNSILSREDSFSNPFTETFFRLMKLKCEEDKSEIKNFFNMLLDTCKNDTNFAFYKLKEKFSEMNDCLITIKENEVNELSEKIKKILYKHRLKIARKANDLEVGEYTPIKFKDFDEIKQIWMNELILEENDEICKNNKKNNKNILEDFLLLMMKKSSKDQNSMHNLNICFLLNLLDINIHNLEDLDSVSTTSLVLRNWYRNQNLYNNDN